MRTQSKKQTTYLKRGKNASDQVEIGFSFAFDWLRWRREISGPITEWSKEKLKQFKITFDT